MNKEEAIKKIQKITRTKYTLVQTEAELLEEVLEQYAQQVSRDRELKLIEWIDNSYGFEEMKGNPDYEFMLSQFNHQNQEDE